MDSSLKRDAQYFLLDGSHKTTAACLTGNSLKVIIVENADDIEYIHSLLATGDMFNTHLPKTIQGNIDDLIEHFKDNTRLETVEEKTNRMIHERVIPEYMIQEYEALK